MKKKKKNPYLQSVKEGKVKDVKLIIEDIFAVDKHGNDMYLLAAKHGHLNIIKCLEEHTSWNIETTNKKGENAFDLVIINDHKDLFNYFRNVHVKLMNKSIKKILDRDIGTYKSFYKVVSRGYWCLSEYLHNSYGNVYNENKDKIDSLKCRKLFLKYLFD